MKGASFAAGYIGTKRRILAEFDIASGEVDYDGHKINVETGEMTPFKVSGFVDKYSEGRLLLGNSFRSGERTIITPYSGIGHRELWDNVNWDKTAFREVETPFRASNYTYTPVGVEIETPLGKLGSLGLKARAEYDHLWQGTQKTDMGHVTGVGWIEPIANTQKSGSGKRLSIEIQKSRRNGTKMVGLELFARSWSIGDSDAIEIPEIPGAFAVEPANKTLQTGVNLTVSF